MRLMWLAECPHYLKLTVPWQPLPHTPQADAHQGTSGGPIGAGI